MFFFFIIAIPFYVRNWEFLFFSLLNFPKRVGWYLPGDTGYAGGGNSAIGWSHKETCTKMWRKCRIMRSIYFMSYHGDLENFEYLLRKVSVDNFASLVFNYFKKIDYEISKSSVLKNNILFLDSAYLYTITLDHFYSSFIEEFY